MNKYSQPAECDADAIPRTSAVELISAYAVSLLIPIFGLILGIWLWNWRKRSGPGAACIILAFLCPVVLFGLIALISKE